MADPCADARQLADFGRNDRGGMIVDGPGCEIPLRVNLGRTFDRIRGVAFLDQLPERVEEPRFERDLLARFDQRLGRHDLYLRGVLSVSVASAGGAGGASDIGLASALPMQYICPSWADRSGHAKRLANRKSLRRWGNANACRFSRRCRWAAKYESAVVVQARILPSTYTGLARMIVPSRRCLLPISAPVAASST